MQMTFRPLGRWPGVESQHRKRAPFRATYADTLDLLDAELQKLGASQVVLQCDVGADEVRLDGQLRAHARPRHPGVVLSFRSRHGPLSYPCDTYDNWQDNLRAIGLALEALRAVDRYGVTKRAEQYRGWSQLPPPPPERPAGGWGTLELARAIEILHTAADLPAGSPATNRGNVRERIAAALKRSHPDHGGNAEWFKHVLAATNQIKAFFKFD